MTQRPRCQLFAAVVRAACLLGLAAPASFAAADIIITEIHYHPASNDVREEFIELHNRGDTPQNLEGWRFTAGVQFTFPRVELWPGQYLVVAADVARFQELHGPDLPVVGGWQGQLGDNGETITLRDAFGQVADTVTYATEGDWGVRTRGPDHRGHRGWVWEAAHDGGGHTLELIGLHRSNNLGQNWAASLEPGGTPGAPNSVAAANVPPFVTDVQHAPAVPRSTQPVAITARIDDEAPDRVEVFLHHRIDGEPDFAVTPMADDGEHGDGGPADGVFGAVLPPQPDGTVVEFYVEARDWEGAVRTWPAPVEPDHAQLANCLYQVSDETYDGPQPLYRVILTAAERAEVEENDSRHWYLSSNAEYNGTFISDEAGEVRIRYNIGFRIRGTTSRDNPVKNRRVNFPNDRRWHGLEAINLNAAHPESQILAAATFRLAGLPAPTARAVRLRENNVDPAAGRVYAEAEVLNSDFASRQFPRDPNGNLYRANSGDLSYLGADPNLYRTNRVYEKKTNRSADDWSDLIDLLAALNETPDADYEAALHRVANVGLWVRYFALNTMVANQETSLGMGKDGDFALYRGVEDPRFILLPYDTDSMFGTVGGLESPLWRATRLATVERFLTHPSVAPLYYAELRRLMDTVFAPATIEPLIDQLLGPWMDEAGRRRLKQFVRDRNAYIAANIPGSKLNVTSVLPFDAYFHTTDPATPMTGTADPLLTRSVTVNGLPAAWDPVLARWSIDAVPLLPGINRIVIQTFDDTGHLVSWRNWDIWRNDVTGTAADGTLPGDTVWHTGEGPFLIRSELTVPAGATLRIEPGVSVFFDSNARMVVRGRLLALGEPTRRIEFTRIPKTYGYWNGILFEDATEENRLEHVDFDYTREQAVFLTNSVFVAEDVQWGHAAGPIIRMRHSSVVVRNSRFPDIQYAQHVSGVGIRPGGRFLLEGNVFGTTTDYQDIVDFSDDGSAGAVVEIRNNHFLGGSDDGLDLDGTEAFIEGNVFENFHKANTSTSESSAIATGEYEGRPARLTVVRNVFRNNDYGMMLKERAHVRLENNTFLGHTHAALGFAEPERPWAGPPERVELIGNLFAEEQAVFGNLDPERVRNGTITLEVRQCLFPAAAGLWPEEFAPAEQGNRAGDPRWVNPPEDLRLRPGSPAAGAGPNGLDIGAAVPAGASISGEPPAVTLLDHATLRVAGPGIVAYRFRLDGAGEWSEPRPVGEPIELTGLPPGPHHVEVIGQDVAGAWQPENASTHSRVWEVDPDAPAIEISEVLAANRSFTDPMGGAADWVELHNRSDRPIDLAGLRLTDDPARPDRFTFPAGFSLAPGERRVFYAGNAGGPEAGWLGFNLNAGGDGLWLFDTVERGGALLDQVTFGPQLPDFSLARDPAGRWTLAEPTPGEANRPVPTGDPAMVRLSEWLANPASGDDFLELHNADTLPVDVGGCALSPEPVTDPRAAVLPPHTFIAPDGYLLLLADGRDDPGHLPFKLSAMQGHLGFTSPAGALLDQAVYEFQQPGVSQGRPVPGDRMVVSFDWPTPGGAPLLVAGESPLRLNEILALNRSALSDAGTLPDWIEILNASDTPVSLEGVTLSDSPDQPGRWAFPAGTLLAPGERRVVLCDPELPPSETNTGFGLNAGGETVFLLRHGQVLDSVTFGPQAADWSIGRIPDGAGDWALTLPTPGAANQAAELGDPSVLRINEWMARPARGDDWIELRNPGPLPVALEGLGLTDTPNSPPATRLPPLSFIGVGAGGYTRLIADGASGGAHLEFRLDGDGESILLLGTDGALIDRVDFGPQSEGVSQGRWPEDSDAFQFFPGSATPGEPNRPAGGLWLRFWHRPGVASRLEWNARPGAAYRVEGAAGLLDGWEPLAEMVAEGDRAHWRQSPPDGPIRFLRVIELPAP